MTIKYLQFQLHRNRAIYPIPYRWNNKNIGANPIAFPGQRRQHCCKPAAIISLWVPIKAAQDGAKFDRSNRNRLVVEASIIGVFAIAIVKTSNSSGCHGVKAVLRASTPIAIIEILILIKVVRHKTGIDPDLTPRLRLHDRNELLLGASEIAGQ